MKRIIVIGAGMGGLAAALLLRKKGHQVTVLEKRPRPGGRSYVIEEDGFRVDTGPTILVMKDQFEETYRALGRDINQRIEFIRLDPNYRIYFHDGRHMDLPADLAGLSRAVETIEPGAGDQARQFIEDNSRKYNLGMPFVTRNYDRLTDLVNPVAGLRLLQTGAHQNLYCQVSRYFKSDELRKAFSFHSMFLGLSPFDALAMYSLITYADLAHGMFYPKGGIYAIIEDMVKLCAEDGVEIHLNAPVEEITVGNGRATGVRIAGGEWLPADAVVANADLPYTYRELVPPAARRRYTNSRLDRFKYACSGYLLYLGVNRTYPELRHQALYFSKDYRATLDSIFVDGLVPADPSFHLNVPTQSDPSLAPAGHSLLYLLAPMPNLRQGRVDWEQAAPQVREQLVRRLEELVDPQIRRHIVWERSYTPLDFEGDLNAVHGTAFGSLAHSLLQSAAFRPNNVSPDVPNLYFAGQGTYPGIGMPMVMISARLVAERIGG